MKIVVISEKTQQKMLVARMLNEDPLLDNIDKDAEKKKKEKELEKKKDDNVIIKKDDKKDDKKENTKGDRKDARRIVGRT